MLTAFLMFGCQKAELAPETQSSLSKQNITKVPYSDSMALHEFDADPAIVSYQFARKIAFVDKMSERSRCTLARTV